MALIRKLFIVLILSVLALGAGLYQWTRVPVFDAGAPIPFTIAPGSGAGAASEQMAAAGVPVNPVLFTLFARASGQAPRIKAGSYELEPGATPRRLVEQLVRGEFAQDRWP
jgi:UPF0755 protein